MEKITQKNYEAIKIYRQKEKLFELKGKIQTLEKENAKLKELVKEVLRHDLSLKEVTELTRKIAQVLGEE